MKKRTCILLLLITAFILFTACTNNNPPMQSPGPSPAISEEDTLKVFFLNVGKADAALIGIPGGYWAMIDTGTGGSFMETGRQLMLNGVINLSAVFITHGHSDHIGGLENVLSMAECENIYTTSDTLGEQAIQSATESGARVNEMNAGDTVRLGEAVFTALGPIGRYGDENDNSLVIMLQYRGEKLLFAADELFTAERDILKLGSAIDADVLKVAHHGQSDSSAREFINAVSPLYAVITTDIGNRPAPQVLDSISMAGGQAFILGETGTMLFESDGEHSGMSPLPAPSAPPPDIRIDAKDSSAEFITIANHANEGVDLTGWCVYSEKGNDVFFFPAGTTLLPGGRLNILSGKAAASGQDGLVWTQEKIWGKNDVCIIYDDFGREVARQ